MKTAKEIYDETLVWGRLTVDLLGNVPTVGYMVSKSGGVKVPLDEFSVRDIEQVITENKNALCGTRGFIGIWIDEETVYVDYSVNFINLGIALIYGHKHEQKAIYSLNTKETIYI